MTQKGKTSLICPSITRLYIATGSDGRLKYFTGMKQFKAINIAIVPQKI